MTEWEQIKKEYREIEIPHDGPHQVMEAMVKAKRQRSRWKRMAGYGTIVAAAVLVIVLPGMAGRFSAENDALSNGTSTSAIMMDTGTFAGGVSGGTTESVTESVSTTITTDSAECDVETAMPEYGATNIQASQKSESVLHSGELEKISQEIIRQMKERMEETEETYFIKSEEYPNGFAGISEESDFYININEEGQLVIVFGAGEVAPVSMGTVEFVIPKEVYSVEERNE